MKSESAHEKVWERSATSEVMPETHTLLRGAHGIGMNDSCASSPARYEVTLVEGCEVGPDINMQELGKLLMSFPQQN